MPRVVHLGGHGPASTVPLGAAALGIFLVIIGIKYDAGVPVVVGFIILLFDWLFWDYWQNGWTPDEWASFIQLWSSAVRRAPTPTLGDTKYL
jgi:hypothetical protein